MRSNVNLKEYVEPALDEILNGSDEILKEELVDEEDRYELKLGNQDSDFETRLVLEMKGNGRPIPTVNVNAVSELGENLLYRSQRMDRSRKLITTVKEALREMLDKLKSG